MIQRVTFIGSKHLGIRVLKTLYELAPDELFSVVTLDDTEDIRSKLDDFRNFCDENNKTLHILSRPSELESIIDNESPEICIVTGWYRILGKQLLEKVPYGFVGIHASMLPRYRGGAPLVWPIINGEKESGVTLFYFDNGMDTGDIVAQQSFSIEEQDTVAEVMEKAWSAADEIIRINYPLLLTNSAPRIRQDHNAATYCSQRTPEDGKIDWKSTNIRIYNEIRAQTSPYPGAFCFTEDNKQLYIIKASLYRQDYYGIPGLVVQTADDYVIVTCGEGAICIHDVGMSSSEIQRAPDVLKYGMRLL